MACSLPTAVLASHDHILHVVVDREIDRWLLRFHLLLGADQRRLQIGVLRMSMMSTHLASAAHQVPNLGSVVDCRVSVAMEVLRVGMVLVMDSAMRLTWILNMVSLTD